jgi:hypothetical protein
MGALLLGVVAVVTGYALNAAWGSWGWSEAGIKAEGGFSDDLHGCVSEASSQVKRLVSFEHTFGNPDLRTLVHRVALEIEEWRRIGGGASNIDCCAGFLKNDTPFLRWGRAGTHIDLAEWAREGIEYASIMRSWLQAIFHTPAQIKCGSLSDIFEGETIKNALSYDERRFVIVRDGHRSNPSAIGVDVALIGMFDAFVDVNQSDYGSAGSGESYHIERPSGANLSIPEGPFFGAIFFGFGAWLSCLGIARGRLALWLVGWPIGVLGSVILLLWAIPLIA